MKNIISYVLCGCFFILLSALVKGIHFDSYQGCSINNKTHNLYYGLRENKDILLFMDVIQKDFKFLQRTSLGLIYPQKEDIQAINITFVEAIDKRSDGTGGCVFLMDGGVGHRHVKLYLVSKWNRGLDFVVRIFGYRINH